MDDTKNKSNNFIQFKRGPVARAKDTAFTLYYNSSSSSSSAHYPLTLTHSPSFRFFRSLLRFQVFVSFCFNHVRLLRFDDFVACLNCD
ncbi:hypothetical protein VNO78_01756 [Psophocarpus tetragonolobus]|uniref:Uncharacterized protein n=1 Tax=Psophocarpus tetragonolobus TaxID=3891 RepID=A0AAN9XUT1_PSOTE